MTDPTTLDFMVRLSVKRLPSPQTGSKRPSYTLVPDGLQHPKFKGLDIARDTTSSVVVPPWQEFDREVPHLFSLPTQGSSEEKNPFLKEVIAASVRHDELPSSLPEYISHLLRLRILQELELLAEAAGSSSVRRRVPAAAETHLERILGHSRGQACARWGRSSHSRRTPAEPRSCHQEAAPAQRVSSPRASRQSTADDVQARPVATVYDVLCLSPEDYQGFPDVITPMKVPLYNGVSLFPRKRNAQHYTIGCARCL
jgi:hypothetical protein